MAIMNLQAQYGGQQLRLQIVTGRHAQWHETSHLPSDSFFGELKRPLRILNIKYRYLRILVYYYQILTPNTGRQLALRRIAPQPSLKGGTSQSLVSTRLFLCFAAQLRYPWMSSRALDCGRVSSLVS